jgi:hypothetical protein
MPPPDCTLTTSCFDLTQFHPGSRSLKEAIEKMRTLLSVPCYLVIYTDINCFEMIQRIRNEYSLDHLTKYVVQRFESLYYYKYIDVVKKNRLVYWPTRDERTCAENHLLQISKVDFVKQTILSNPFSTTTFGWIDANCGIGFSKIAENYMGKQTIDTKELLLSVLRSVPVDKLHLQVLNVVDKKFKEKEAKREFYSCYRWIVCGSFYTMGPEIGFRFIKRMDELFREATEQGFGHGDELLMLEILDEFYDEIDRGYGDYAQILNNYSAPVNNLWYIYHCIVKNYLEKGYYKECCAVCQKVVDSVENLGTHVMPDVYIPILFAYRESTEDKKNITELIERVCARDPAMKAEASKHF